MIPLKDTIKSNSFPFINTILIVVNILIFIYEFSLGKEFNKFIYNFGLIPASVTSIENFGFNNNISPFFTSMFLHGGWFHLIGNMLFLYIFGDNVEDKMGHLKYLIFYLICGIAAAILQIITNLDSIIPMVGASGAISGVLGAYLLFFPNSKILTIVPIFIFIQLMRVPAKVFIIIWFFVQFLSGLGTLGASSSGGGIAFWAHIGGFIAGVIFANQFAGKISYRQNNSNSYYRH